MHGKRGTDRATVEILQTNGDIASIAAQMEKVIETTLDCYGGNCRSCKNHSVVCRGGMVYNWWVSKHSRSEEGHGRDDSS